MSLIVADFSESVTVRSAGDGVVTAEATLDRDSAHV
jgi:hypothetical protein